MRSWQVCVTLTGWALVLALILVNYRGLSVVTYVAVALWALFTLAMLRTPAFPARGIAFTVSWVGPLLWIVWNLYTDPNRRLGFESSNVVILSLTTVLVYTWLFTYGVVPMFAAMKLIWPGFRCGVFYGSEQVPWRYWWVPTLLCSTPKLAVIWWIWAIARSASG